MNILGIISTILLTTIMAVSCAAESDKQINSIGFAQMLENGTITLTLVARAEGIIGDAQFIYDPEHKDYQMVLEHIGGIKPGEIKNVPPWPDKD